MTAAGIFRTGAVTNSSVSRIRQNTASTAPTNSSPRPSRCSSYHTVAASRSNWAGASTLNALTPFALALSPQQRGPERWTHRARCHGRDARSHLALVGEAHRSVPVVRRTPRRGRRGGPQLRGAGLRQTSRESARGARPGLRPCSSAKHIAARSRAQFESGRLARGQPPVVVGVSRWRACGDSNHRPSRAARATPAERGASRPLIEERSRPHRHHARHLTEAALRRQPPGP